MLTTRPRTLKHHAKNGNLDQAIAHGRAALLGDRRSLPSLIAVSHELATTLQHNFSNEPETRDYLDLLSTLNQQSQ